MSDAPLDEASPGRWTDVIALSALALGVRLLAIAPGVAWFHSDSAIHGLMSKRVATGEALPVYYLGQQYIGGLGAWLAAPAHWLAPGDPRGPALAQALLFALLTIPLLYRLLLGIGGRLGACLGCGLLAIGNRTLIQLTSGEWLGYAEMLPIALGLLLLTPRLVERPSAWRAFAVGGLLGLGLWTNPQFLQFAAPCALALLFAGALPRAIAEGALRQRIGRLGVALFVIGLVALAAVLARALISLAIGEDESWAWLTTRHPQRWLKRAAVGCGLGLVAFELWARKPDRRWWARAGALLAGALLALGPALADGLLGEPRGGPAPLKLTVSRFAHNADLLGLRMTDLFVGHRDALAESPETLRPLERRARQALAASLAALAVAAIVEDRKRLLAMLRVRPQTLGPGALLGAQAAVLLGLWMLHHGGGSPRYLLALSLPFAGLIAWLARRLPTAGIALAALLATCWAGDLGLYLSRLGPEQLGAPERALIERLEQEELRAGYGFYWTAVKVSYMADERVVLGAESGIGRNRLPEHLDRADACLTPVFVFDRRDPEQRDFMRSWLPKLRAGKDRHHGALVRTFSEGPYDVVVTRRKRPRSLSHRR